MVYIQWGGVHQDNQEDEKGCREAEPVHLRGLAVGLLRILGWTELLISWPRGEIN